MATQKEEHSRTTCCAQVFSNRALWIIHDGLPTSETNHSFNRLWHLVNKSCSSHTHDRGTTAVTRGELPGRLLDLFQDENWRIHCEQQCSSCVVPHSEAKKEERWNRNMLGILGNLWSLQKGRVEVNPNSAAPA